MCGRFTVKANWAELVALYRLTMNAPGNLRPRYNVCPTDPVDVVTAVEGKRELVPMRWGLIPRWWSKTIKEAKMATFNARAETIETKPFFRDAFKRTRCLIPLSGYYEWLSGRKAALVFHSARWLAALHSCGPLGRMERSPDWRAAEVLHNDHHRAQRLRRGNPRPDAGVLDGEAIRPVAQRRPGRGPTGSVQSPRCRRRSNGFRRFLDEAAVKLARMYGAKLCVLGHGVEFTTSGGISFGRSRLASFVTSPKFGLMARA
jgi:SOS response associated peptidase (SRAP)